MKSMSIPNEIVPTRDVSFGVVEKAPSVVVAFCILSSGCGGIIEFTVFSISQKI